MAKIPNAFCAFCGTAFAQTQTYPRNCPNPACGMQTWANPIPVSVVLLPVRVDQRVGLMVVRRSIEPRKGFLALLGGFLEEHENWQHGGAREIREESGIVIDPKGLRPFWFTSTEPRPNRVLLFSVADVIDAKDLPPFQPSNETSEMGVIFGSQGLEEVFAFPLHIEAAKRFFLDRGYDGPHGYVASSASPPATDAAPNFPLSTDVERGAQ